MSFIDKLKFWKKEDDFDFPEPEPMQPQQRFDPLAQGQQLGQQVPDYPSPAQQQPGEPQFDTGQDFDFARPTQQPSGVQSYPRPSFQEQPQAQMSSDQQLQLMNSKLDTIKAQLETVLQRLDRLEGERQRPYQRRWQGT